MPWIIAIHTNGYHVQLLSLYITPGQIQIPALNHPSFRTTYRNWIIIVPTYLYANQTLAAIHLFAGKLKSFERSRMNLKSKYKSIKFPDALRTLRGRNIIFIYSVYFSKRVYFPNGGVCMWLGVFVKVNTRAIRCNIGLYYIKESFEDLKSVFRMARRWKNLHRNQGRIKGATWSKHAFRRKFHRDRWFDMTLIYFNVILTFF